MTEAPKPPSQLRLFVALTLPKPVVDKVEKAQDELRRALQKETVRWTKRDHFHLTLRFLGNVDAEQLDPLKEALTHVCADFPTLRLRAERIGFFPHARSPRVVWAGVTDNVGKLGRLQRLVDGATRDFSAEKTDEKFAGHVTLGRIKEIRRQQADELFRLACDMAKRSFFGEWTADEVHLIRSDILADGPHYSTLAKFPLLSAPGL